MLFTSTHFESPIEKGSIHFDFMVYLGKDLQNKSSLLKNLGDNIFVMSP